jgi:hypothetical protein
MQHFSEDHVRGAVWLELGETSKIHYNGISQGRIEKEFKGEVIYNQEVQCLSGQNILGT